jgi:hypothetical protein
VALDVAGGSCRFHGLHGGRVTTYAVTDASTQDGQPVELYKVTISRGDTFLSPAVLAGAIALDDLSDHGADVTASVGGMDMSTWTEVFGGACSTCGSATAGWSFDAYGGNAGAIAHATYCPCLSLGEAGGHFYRTGTLTGLTPGAGYKLLCYAMSAPRPEGVYRCGIKLNGALETLLADFPDESTWYGHLKTVTANASGEILVDAGWFDAEYMPGGYPDPLLVSVALIGVYEATGTDTGGGGGGGEMAGGLGTLYYTSADVPVAFEGNEYLPAILTRSELTSGGRETGDGDVDLTMARDHAVARCFHYGTPQLPVALTLYALHRDNLTADGDGTYTVTDEAEVRTLLEGAMGTRPRFRGNACTLAFAPAETLVDRTVPRYTCSRACPWLLYDVHTCKVNRATFALTGVTVDAVSGRVVTVPGLAAWAGSDAFKAKHGVLIPPSGAQETITDVDLTAETVTLLNVIPGLAPGDVVDILAGCDQLIGTCRTRFDNVVNFGGWPDMPVRNPWTGGGLS